MRVESHGEMILTGENGRTRRKPCPSDTLPAKNPTWIDSGANLGLRGKKSATNCLSHGTAYSWSKETHRSPKRHTCDEINTGSSHVINTLSRSLSSTPLDTIHPRLVFLRLLLPFSPKLRRVCAFIVFPTTASCTPHFTVSDFTVPIVLHDIKITNFLLV
jgi:hypothetical protein